MCLQFCSYVLVNLSNNHINKAQLFYISQIFYVIVLVLTKISILILYLRIFPQRIFQYAAIASIIVIGLHGIIFAFITAFQCVPVYSNWDQSITGKCLSQNAIVLVGAASSIVQDLLVLALPIPVIKSLNLKTGKRATLIIMFSIGSLLVKLNHLNLRY